MKINGYYDLLLQLNEEINNNFQIAHVKEEQHRIKDFDYYLMRQLNSLLLRHLPALKNPVAKINFINAMISNVINTQFSENILLQVNNECQNKVLYDNDIRLSDTFLFTNEHQQSLINHLNQELQTCDEACLIYPFISQSLLNKLRTAFNYALKHNIKINIITTTFDGQALFVNIDTLIKLGKKYPNVKIKVEDNFEKRSERIHIKAAIFKRKTGFSSALIGSSNLTVTGMTTGREWNIKINEFDNKQLYDNMLGQYYKLWQEPLIDLSDQAQMKMLLQRIEANRLLTLTKGEHYLSSQYVLYDFQKALIAKLQLRRTLHKSKHLLVMATGVGKTVIAAFDYVMQMQEGNNIKPRILFLAHQSEIVQQALTTFRQVLNDHSFGTILQPRAKNSSDRYLFATVQTVYLHRHKFAYDQFDIIVFDEAHHLAAKTFSTIWDYFQPRQILGLTATPERTDNKDILPYFDYEFAHELRLWDAINEKLLVPFDYYCIDDITSDLTGVDLNDDRLLFHKLNTSERNELLFNVINEYIGYYASPICVIFCINIAHAQIVAHFLQSKGLRAAVLTSKVTTRTQIINDFKNKNINYLCVVNIFNEGIDIPDINTIILLRPTNSKTIYLQQLGRGLRKTATKKCLEVYDLIANIDKKYDLTLGIKNLVNCHLKPSAQLNTNNWSLPYGCTITLEPRSQDLILDNLRKWYQSRSRIAIIVSEYYERYQEQGLERILADYDLTISEFYNFCGDFYLHLAQKEKRYFPGDNDSKRNINLLKQFLFLNNYDIVNYFYLRLSSQLAKKAINADYDNLLIASLLYEVTSMHIFVRLFPDWEHTADLVSAFIATNRLIVKELLIVLEHKLATETLLMNKSKNKEYPLLSYQTTFTVHQALCAINRVNYLKSRGPLKIIAFQAGYLTFDNNKTVVFADIGGNNYGKLTQYYHDQKIYYWSIPENKTIACKLVKDLQNAEITKLLFLNNALNKNYQNLSLKLYCFVGFGTYLETLISDYITLKFLVT